MKFENIKTIDVYIILIGCFLIVMSALLKSWFIAVMGTALLAHYLTYLFYVKR